MSKVIDITDKLTFDEKPKIKINGEEFTVNDDAYTVLQLISKSDEDTGSKRLMQMYSLMFSHEDRERIDALRLNTKDFFKMIELAAKIATGSYESEEQQGEETTPATT